MVQCPNCGNEMRENAKFCSNCGSSAPETAVEYIPDQETAKIEEITEISGNETEITESPSEFAEKFNEKDGIFLVKDTSKSEPAPVQNIFEDTQKYRYYPPVKKIIAATAFVALAVGAYVIPNIAMPAMKYSSAEALFRQGSYAKAETAFATLNGYENSEDYILKCRYASAEKLLADGMFTEANVAFTALGEYSDSTEKAEECMLKIAENSDFETAMQIYSAAGKTDLVEETILKRIEQLSADGDYLGASELAEKYLGESSAAEYRYMYALSEKEARNFKNAAVIFGQLNDYKDSVSQTRECAYGFYCADFAENGASEEIVRGFFSLEDYENSPAMFKETSYAMALKYTESGDYANAVAMLRNAVGYKDSGALLYDARYNLGKSLMDSDPASARSVFALLSTYSDSAEQKKVAAAKIPDDHADWYADAYTQAGEYFTTNFRKSDTLLVSCTAATDTISQPITLVLTLRDSAGAELSADCENVRNSSFFSGSFSLANSATGEAEILISRKDNGAVLRVIPVNIEE